MTADVTSPGTSAPSAARRSPATPSWRPEAAAVLVALVMLLVQVCGYALGWSDHESAAITLWYLGLVGIVAPFAWLLLVPTRTGHQRLASSLAFGVVMYASWLLSNPVMATRFDETQHVTTLVDMIDLHRFFYPNSTLPVSPHYPGLELATAGIHWLTGLPLIACSIVVVLTARITLVLALFLLTSRIGRSTRVGSAAVLLYGASPQFYLFNSQFAYQTVAIAMLVAALYLLVRAFDAPQERPWRELVGAQGCLAALAVTHHLTSWLAIAVLWALTLFFRFGHQHRRFRLTLITAEIASVIVAAWTAVITPLLISYLGPIFDIATAQLIEALDGSGGGREIGSASNGEAAPTWELMVMAAAILLWIVLLVPSLWSGWRGQARPWPERGAPHAWGRGWRLPAVDRPSLGTSRARYVPLAVAAAYPFLQLGRFSTSAAEVADRASTFVALAMALVVGVWIAARVERFSRLIVPGAVILVLGGTILGSGPDWQRVPGPYLAGAEQRSVDSETVAVAQWAGTYLPTDAHVAADSTLTRVLPNFAPVVPLTQPAGYDSMTPLFIAHSIDQNVLRLVLRDDVDFVFVDTRLVGQTVRSGAFFEGGDGYGPDASTVTSDQVTKFDDADGFRLVLDGPVKVYDVRGLRGAAETFPTPREPPGIPGSWSPWQVAITALLLALGLGLRGRLLDPRRFRARDIWRVAVVLPVAMVVGAVGVVARFTPAAGIVAAVVVGYVLIAASDRPAPLPAGPRGTRGWSLAAGVIAGLAVALAIWAAWHGLLDHAALPAPRTGTDG